MQQVNGTGFSFGANQAFDSCGKLHMIAVVKATYVIPEFPDAEAAVSEDQVPIFDSDQYEGEPGKCAPNFESDWSLAKQRCDVVLKTNAYSPNRRAVKELQAGFRLGDCEKIARITGPRRWEKSDLGLVPSEAEDFQESSISYENSFGGTWHDTKNDAYEVYSSNPVGRGYAEKFKSELEGMLLPAVQKPDENIIQPNKEYTPWSFGPLGRNWNPRIRFAGTYDDAWKENTFPFLPADFDNQYFQCVPADQQIEYPSGGEKVTLLNLHPERPIIHFKLPKNLHMPMVALMKSQQQLPISPVVDTICIDVEKNIFSLVWRGQLPLKRSLREVNIVAVGPVCRKWWKAQVFGSSDCGCGGTESDSSKVISIDEAMLDE